MTSQNDLIFLGDSLTAFHDWSAFGQHRNAGIAGDTTDGILYRLHHTLDKKPKTLVLMIGINDLLQHQEIDTIKENYKKILEKVETIDKVVILSLLPVQTVPQRDRINEQIIRLNHFLKRACHAKCFDYVDVYSHVVDKEGGIKKELTTDGVHLTAPAYTIWERQLMALLH